jgi:hypothetical protein
MKKLFLGLASLFAAGSVSAAHYVTENIKVPFSFNVDKVAMPAGEYRLEQDPGKYVVSIVNVHTGRRVQMLRDNVNHTPGRAKLIFEPTGQGYKLARVS